MEHVAAREQSTQLLTRLISVLTYGTAQLLEALPAKIALTCRVTIVNLLARRLLDEAYELCLAVVFGKTRDGVAVL